MALHVLASIAIGAAALYVIGISLHRYADRMIAALSVEVDL
jgi:hypothetical protein